MMMSHHPDIRRRLKDRLLSLTPRAFEFFAGDALSFIGLENIHVTRYVGDGGIDASGELVSASQLVRVPTGVQMKRHRANIQRADIDQFLGALFGTYQHGIFITTADYADAARRKAQQSALRVDVINGDHLVQLLRHHSLGVLVDDDRIDEEYFSTFEQRAGQPMPPAVTVPDESSAPDDLISLRAFSYELRVDPLTLTGWIARRRVVPDQTLPGTRPIYLFRRARIAELRSELNRTPLPTDGAQWRQQFLEFARSRQLTKSYKPVLLLVLLELVDRDGCVALEALSRAFLSFYQQRQRDGLPVEFGVPLLVDSARVPLEEIRRLIVRYPLDRFRIQHFLELEGELVRINPQLWRELRISDLIELREAAHAQLRWYYARGGSDNERRST